MGNYISFYKATNIDITSRKDVNVIRQQLIKQLYKRIHTPIAISHKGIRDVSYLEEMEAYRLSSIPAKRKNIKWLRKASCKQVIKYAHEVGFWLFGNTLYQDLYGNFPIGRYLEEDKYNHTFKNYIDFCQFIEKESSTCMTPDDQDIIYYFFKRYGKKGLIQVF
jgi:hypothetical protein